MTYTTTQRDCDRVELEARFKFERGQAWLSGAMVGAGVTGVLMIIMQIALAVVWGI